MLWVLRGLKHITKLICPLHRRPCPRSVLRLPPSLHFSTDVFVIRERRWEATRHHSGEISSACRPLIFWLQELCAARLWWKKIANMRCMEGGVLPLGPHAGDGCVAVLLLRQCGSLVGRMLLSQLFMCVLHVNRNSTPFCSSLPFQPLFFFHARPPLFSFFFFVNTSVVHEKEKERGELDRQRTFCFQIRQCSLLAKTVIVKMWYEPPPPSLSPRRCHCVMERLCIVRY